MGMYVYRVSARRVKCVDGKDANVAVYAYKPHGWDEAWNRKAEFRSGCHASRKLASEGKLSDRVVIEYSDGYISRSVYGNPNGYGVFLDDCNLGVPGRMPKLPVACNVNPDPRE